MARSLPVAATENRQSGPNQVVQNIDQLISKPKHWSCLSTSSSYLGAEIFKCTFPSPRWPYPTTTAAPPARKPVELGTSKRTLIMHHRIRWTRNRGFGNTTTWPHSPPLQLSTSSCIIATTLLSLESRLESQTHDGSRSRRNTDGPVTKLCTQIFHNSVKVLGGQGEVVFVHCTSLP